MNTLDVDQKILRYLRRFPGANTEQTARALLTDYSGAYTKDRLQTLIARGKIRAEVSPANRYKLYVADDDATAEAVKA